MSPQAPSLPAPRTLVLSLLAAVMLTATATSAYLVWHHENALYGDANAELGNCPTTETINCEAVNSSEYSEVAGVPLAAWGIATYLFLFGVAAASRRRPQLLNAAFGVGLLMTLASGYLFYVSKVKIGFLCLWCLRLYAINLVTPVLVAVASRRNPLELVRGALGDLTRWPKETRVMAAAFVGLVVITVGGQRGYRASLTRLAKTEAATAKTPAETTGKLGAMPPLVQLVKGSKPEPFDLSARLGHGKPLALFFWAPGFRLSEIEFLKTAAFLRKEAPELPLFAVAGRREDQRLDGINEVYHLLGGPADVPLLIDEKFAVAKALSTEEVPSLALFDASGALITAKVKSMTHVVTTKGGRMTGEDLVRAVAAGKEVGPIDRPLPYYPGSELYGSCAPTFHLPDFATGKDVEFTGKSSSGRPTLLMFWSSTCKHCQKEIPALIANYKAHPGAYDVVGITTIKKDKANGPSHRKLTETYIASTGLPWTVLEDADASVGELYKVISTPTTFLIAPNGEVVDAWYFVHPDLDAAIEKDLVKLNARTGACRPAPPEPRPHLEVQLTAADGKDVPLSTLATGPTLVHFWATWCAPCLKELPSFLKFKDRVGKDGKVVFVSVEDAESGGKIEAFEKEHALSFESYRAPHGGLADEVDLAYAVPRTFLLAAGGEVLDVRYGDQPWDDPDFEKKVRARMQLPGVSAGR